MDFIIPFIISIFLAPFVGFVCATIAGLYLCMLGVAKKRPLSEDIWQATTKVFTVCTLVAPFLLVLGWAAAVDASMHN